jgi:hypothetical protein
MNKTLWREFVVYVMDQDAKRSCPSNKIKNMSHTIVMVVSVTWIRQVL